MQQEVMAAVQMLRKGATRGMVAKKLEHQGVLRHQCSDVVAAAQTIVHRRQRMLAVLAAIAGFVVLAAGILLFLLFRANGRILVGMPIFAAMAGAMLIIYGFSDALRKRE